MALDHKQWRLPNDVIVPAIVAVNTLSSGVSDATAYTIANSSVEATVGALVVPANSLTINGTALAFQHNALFLNNTGGNTTIRFKILNGATTYYDSNTSAGIATSANSRVVQIIGAIRRITSTTGHLSLTACVGTATAATTGNGGFDTAAFNTTAINGNIAIDWTIANTLTFTMKLSSGSPNHTYTVAAHGNHLRF